MDTFEAIATRRSVKHFDPEHRFTEAEIRQLLEAAMLSPTSFNLQNWRFVVVTDPELKQELRAASYNQAQFTDASIIVYLVFDKEAHSRQPQRYWRHAEPEIGQMMVGMIQGVYEGNEPLVRDEGQRSCGIAGQTLMLAARSMGYDSCPIVGIDKKKTAALLRMPEDHEISFAVTIGKALQPARPRAGQLAYEEVVIQDRFPG
ncbi:MAG: nitroreductase family protein [Planctomycetes bacterium]|nr:nitroreductase family protein [Planctomycetota bacterium]